MAARPLKDTPYAINTVNMLVTAVEQGECPGFPAAAMLDYLGHNAYFQRPRHRWNLALLEARLAARAGLPDAAAQRFLTAYTLRPRQPEPALRAARLWLEAGKSSPARSVLDDIAPTVESWPSALRREYRRLRERVEGLPATNAGSRASGLEPHAYPANSHSRVYFD